MSAATQVPDPLQIQLKGKPRAGMLVTANTMPPDGWQVVNFGQGRCELHPLPPADFNPNEATDLLKLVDQEWERQKQMSREQAIPLPDRMYVNNSFRRLFRTLREWDGAAEIEVTNDKAILPTVRTESRKIKPQFKFERTQDQRPDEELWEGQ